MNNQLMIWSVLPRNWEGETGTEFSVTQKEIEKGLGGLDDQTGINRAILGIFLSWMQDRTSKIFLVATCNGLGSMPPELLRKGRFDEIFYVGNPDWSDRIEILKKCLSKYENLGLSDGEIEAFACYRLRDFSGAEIDSLVHEAALISYENEQKLDIHSLQKAVMDFSTLQAHSPAFKEALRKTEELGVIAKPVSSNPGKMPDIADKLKALQAAS